MQQFKLSHIFAIIALLFVLSVERVVGIPIITFLLFYHIFLLQKIIFKGIALSIFILLLATVYLANPMSIALIVLVGFVYLQFQNASTVQSKSWSYVYVSLVQAAAVAFVSGLVISSSVLASLCIQVLLIVLLLRRVVFNGISQVFHWQKQVFSKELNEKSI